MNLNNGMQPSFLTPSASSNNDESCNNDESWLVKCFRRETAAAPWQRQASPMPVAAWFYGFILLLLTDDSDKSAAGLTGGRMTVIVHWQWLSAAQHSWWKTHRQTDNCSVMRLTMSLTLSQQNRQGSSIHNDNDARIRPVEKINDNDNDGPHTPKGSHEHMFSKPPWRHDDLISRFPPPLQPCFPHRTSTWAHFAIFHGNSASPGHFACSRSGAIM